MKSSQFWKSPEASADEHAQAVAALKEQAQGARDDLQAAQGAFDLRPTVENENTLTEAHAAIAKGSLHLERAERLLAAAQAREEAVRVAAIEAEANDLMAESGEDRLRELAAPLLTEEAELFFRVASLRAAREHLGREARLQRARAWQLRTSLGHNETLPDYSGQIDFRHLARSGLEKRTSVIADHVLRNQLEFLLRMAF